MFKFLSLENSWETSKLSSVNFHVFQHDVDVRASTLYKNFCRWFRCCAGKAKVQCQTDPTTKDLAGILFDGDVADQFGVLAKFERASLGGYKIAALSVDVSWSKSSLELFTLASVTLVLERHGITEGVLVLDESDRSRSKRTKRIHKVHKQKHKASGGYVNGQTVVLLLLVTQSVTFPVGFAFYMPDPVLTAWTKEDSVWKKRAWPKKIACQARAQ